MLTHRLRAAVGYRLPETVTAAVTRDGEMLMNIGGCCDRGELSLRGRVDSVEICGRWEEVRIGDIAGDRFALRRLP